MNDYLLAAAWLEGFHAGIEAECNGKVGDMEAADETDYLAAQTIAEKLINGHPVDVVSRDFIMSTAVTLGFHCPITK